MGDDTQPGRQSDIGRYAVVPFWILERSSARALQLFVTLADYANREREAWPSRATLAQRLDVSLKTVDDAMASLVEIGAVEKLVRKRGDGGQTSNLYRLRFVEGGREAEEEGGGNSASPELEPDEPTSSSPDGELVPSREIVAANGGEPRLWKVDRRAVTESEGLLARGVLAEWNQQTGQELRSRDWLAKIVMRVRERPELGIEDHSHVIAAALRDPWWRGPASPSVVYGNGAQFERSILAATTGADRNNMTGADLRRLLDSLERRSA